MEDVVKKYQKLAAQFIFNATYGIEGGERHDRISPEEKKTILLAHKDGLTAQKIAEIFKRDQRSITNILIAPPLMIEMLEVDKPGKNQNTGKPGKLVSFRLVNSSNDLIVIETICLQVLSCRSNDRLPPIAGLINTYRFNVELNIDKTGEYLIATDYKLAGPDVDKFEIVCTSEPGIIYKAKIKVYFKKYPSTQTHVLKSDPFELTFYKARKSIGKVAVQSLGNTCLVTEDRTGNLAELVNNGDHFNENDNCELRLFIKDNMSDIALQRLNQILQEFDIALREPVRQAMQILFLGFKYNVSVLNSIATLEIPSLVGWQLFNYKDTDNMEEYNRKHFPPNTNEQPQERRFNLKMEE